MERLKAEKPKFRQLKRIGTMALAATIALSVPAVSNVVSKVSPVNNTVVSAAEQTNLMVNASSQFTVNHNDEYEHWTHGFVNDAEIQVDGPEFDVTDLTYVVKFPDELAHLLSDDYVLDYLFGRITNFDSAQNPFTFTGYAIDEDGEQITISKDEHEPYKHISVNTETNSIEFDFTSFYTENNLEPHVRQDVLGDYYFNNLGFTTSIIVPDSRILDNGTYEFKSAYVRGTSVDLDNVENAYTENLVIDYSTDPEPEPEPDVDTTELAALLAEAEDYAEEDYTEESFEALVIAAGEALDVFDNENATQVEVDTAVTNLQTAIDGLVEVEDPEPEPDTSDLDALVAEANGYDSEDYTDESFAALTSAIATAEDVLGDGTATQGDIDIALATLQNAIDNLEPIEEPEEPTDSEVDKSDLAALVEEANAHDSEDYTEESFAVLTSAIATAEGVLENDEATEDEVNEALEELQAAIDGLEVAVEEPTPEPKPEPTPEVDSSELDTVLTNAEGYNFEDYTEESFGTLTAAIEGAEAVLTDEDATQEEVDAALAALETAIAGLVEDETKTETPKEDDEVSIIDDGSDDEAEKDEGNRLPNTATSSFNMILGGFLTLLVGAGSLLLGRRKLN